MRAARHLLGLLGLLAVQHASGKIHQLDISSDQRTLFKIETFCFEKDGVMNITVRDFQVHGGKKDDAVKSGFIMVKTKSESAMQQMLEQSVEDNTCILDGNIFSKENILVDMSTESNDNIPVEKRWNKYNKMHVVQAGDEGFYSLVFARCQPSDTAVSVSFKLHAAFWNPGPNYLSACEKALPVLFFTFFVFFAAATGVWIWLLVKGGNKVQKIHYMMALLLVIKTMAMLFESIRYHFIATTGVGHEWSVIYYIFAFLKGLLLFTVILLIGTGWSLVKPYLNDREKKIVLVVLILQVIDNVALIVLEEMAPGSQEWYTWRDVLHLVDIICCCAILFPIVWSIRHLRQAAGADGKAAHNIMKLTLFRQFYIMVVTYIYFTRIIVFLLAATMPYDWMWLRFVFTELATLSFYVVTGYKFKPAEDNPYLKVELEDPDELEEFGLDAEGELEMEQVKSRVEV